MSAIVLFKAARWSGTNASVEAQLRRQFPDDRLVVVDVLAELRARKPLLAGLLAEGLVRLRPPLHRGKGERAFFMFSPRAQRRIEELAHDAARRKLEGERPRFTFQTTGRFRSRIEGVPQFTYFDTAETMKPVTRRSGRRTRLENEVVALEQSIVDASEAVFTMAENVRQALLADYGASPDRVVTVNAGPNTEPDFRPELRDPDARLVLFVAVEWGRKGGDLLVDAFKRVQPDFPDARLVIAGCRPPVSGAGIEVLGRVPRERVSALLSQATVFCLPSRRDFFPISLLEAMHYRLPAIVSRTGGVPEMVEDRRSALLVDVGDVDGIERALRELLGSRERREQVGAAAQERATELFSWDAVGDRIGAAIRERMGAAA
jgi:glycosyltransferase involved in cell wall biosynthesis